MLMKKKSKFSVTAIALSALIMTATGPVFAKPSVTIDVDYVALGDSLAAGVTPDNLNVYPYFALDKSYTDLIADKLHKGVVSGDYINYGFPLYTTDHVLGLIQPPYSAPYPTFAPNPVFPVSDQFKPYYRIVNKTSMVPVTDGEVVAALLDAEIVTLDIGSNNIAPYVKAYVDGGMTDVALAAALADVAPNVIADILNIAGTIQATRMASGEEPAQIYIMGLYNAFPGATDEQQALINELLTGYNSSLASALSNIGTQVPGINFVDVSNRMENPTSLTMVNIHPTLKGYKTISQCFWKEITQDFDF